MKGEITSASDDDKDNDGDKKQLVEVETEETVDIEKTGASVSGDAASTNDGGAAKDIECLSRSSHQKLHILTIETAVPSTKEEDNIDRRDPLSPVPHSSRTLQLRRSGYYTSQRTNLGKEDSKLMTELRMSTVREPDPPSPTSYRRHKHEIDQDQATLVKQLQAPGAVHVSGISRDSNGNGTETTEITAMTMEKRTKSGLELAPASFYSTEWEALREVQGQELDSTTRQNDDTALGDEVQTIDTISPTHITTNRTPCTSTHNSDDANDTEGIISAQIVDEEELEAQIMARREQEIRLQVMTEAVEATAVTSDESKGSCDSPFLFLHQYGGIFTGFILSVMIIVLVVLVIPTDNDRVVETTPPPLSVYDELVQLMSPISGVDAMLDPTTPQFAALEWLVTQSESNITLISPVTSMDVPSMLLERYVVALLYFATNGEAWRNPVNFLTADTSVCEWSQQQQPREGDTSLGIHCDRDGSVVKIQLDQNNLKGIIPAEISALTSLELLSLADNSLTGAIPASIGSLERLDTLNLQLNQLSSSIPLSLVALGNLEDLRLYHNRLTGTIPPGLTQIDTMEYLLLSDNFFTGIIPEFVNQGSFQQVSLQDNLLSGTISDSLTGQLALDYLALDGNYDLMGTISESFRLLTKLESLSLGNCQVSGTIPSQLGYLENIKYLYLHGMKLVGTIPTDLGELRRIEHILLSSNQLTGTIPREMARLERLATFRVDHNLLTGGVPTEFGSMPLLWGSGLVDVSFNSLTESLDPVFCIGPIPPPVILMADCSEVDCSCCTDCCDDASDECGVNVPAVCDGLRSFYESMNNEEYSSFGTECVCLEDGFVLSCSDRGCNSCNTDESVCATAIDYGYVFDESGVDNNWRCTMQYVVGRNETVSFHVDYLTNDCQVFVDGVKCNTCEKVQCDDSGLLRPVVDCSNIEPDAILNTCNPPASADHNGGLLAVFHEEFFFSECSPCLD